MARANRKAKTTTIFRRADKGGGRAPFWMGHINGGQSTEFRDQPRTVPGVQIGLWLRLGFAPHGLQDTSATKGLVPMFLVERFEC